jgi:D-alanyl-D-alanine endopeptidase (penicillin-binding protein 7)
MDKSVFIARSCLGISLALFITTAIQAQTKQVVSTYLYDIGKNEVVMSADANVPKSIASITKIMTAMVALDHDRDLNRRIKVKSGGKLPAGWHTRRDVMAAMLIRSDNRAADALAADFPGGAKAFVSAMNQRARRIGLNTARFADASGLDARNMATAGEVAEMVKASALYPFIVETSVQKQALFDINLRQKVRTIELQNTNRPLLFEFDEIVISKTGFTSAAGWCVALMVSKNNQNFIVVVLGARTKQERLDITRKIVYNQLKDIEIDYRIEMLPWYQRLFMDE